ncbi:MAG: hypothetical protein ACE5HO_02670 [bacterium]
MDGDYDTTVWALMVRIKSYAIFLIILVGLGLLGCGKKEKIRATILPPEIGATLQFRGYVTDDEIELTSEIYNFDRTVTEIDTVEGHQVYVFRSENERTPFYTDDVGTVRQLVTINLTDKVIPHNLTTPRVTLIKYWETLLKVDQGVGTEWRVLVDTTFQGIDSTGKPQKIRYYYSAKAKYEGWSQTAIPEVNRFVRVLDVHWYEIENYVVNETSGDSLFVWRGTAHHYFDPALGLVKYISDYKKRVMNQSYVSRHGTWELVGRKMPTL